MIHDALLCHGSIVIRKDLDVYYSKPLIQLAKRDESVRQTLLGMAPDRMRPDMWIDVLEATGVADELRSGKHDAAAWAERYIRMLQDQWNADYPRKLCPH